MADVIIDGGNAFSTYAQPSGVTPPDLTGSVFSPTVTTSTAHPPYITPAEFTEAGTGVDTSQLVPGGSTADNAAALVRSIARASAWADNLTHKTLAPTVDVQAGRYRPRDGLVRIPLRLAPVIAVQWVSFGPNPYTLTPVAGRASSAAVQPPATLVLAAPGATYGFPCGPGFYQVSYVNGYGACTTLAGSAVAGDLFLTLATNLGVAPGMLLTVDDGGFSEQVTVSPSYVLGATGPVPLAAGCVYAHAAGAAVNAMPQDIKQAVILLTAALIKTRGNRAFVMSSIAAPSGTAPTQAGGEQDEAMAKELLAPYRRVW